MKNLSFLAALFISAFVLLPQASQAAPTTPKDCVARAYIGLLRSGNDVRVLLSADLNKVDLKPDVNPGWRVFPIPGGVLTQDYFKSLMNKLTSAAYITQLSGYNMCAIVTAPQIDNHLVIQKDMACKPYGYDPLTGRGSAGYSAKAQGSMCGCYYNNQSYATAGKGMICKQYVYTPPENPQNPQNPQNPPTPNCTGGRTLNASNQCACPNGGIFDGVACLPGCPADQHKERPNDAYSPCVCNNSSLLLINRVCVAPKACKGGTLNYTTNTCNCPADKEPDATGANCVAKPKQFVFNANLKLFGDGTRRVIQYLGGSYTLSDSYGNNISAPYIMVESSTVASYANDLAFMTSTLCNSLKGYITTALSNNSAIRGIINSRDVIQFNLSGTYYTSTNRSPGQYYCPAMSFTMP